MQQLIEFILSLILFILATLGAGATGPQITPSTEPLVQPMDEPAPIDSEHPSHFMILQEFHPSPDVLLVLAWIGSRDQGGWVRACATVTRFGEKIQRPPHDQVTAPLDWPDVMFAFWPADALDEVWFAAGDVGEEPPACDEIQDWPGALVIRGGRP